LIVGELIAELVNEQPRPEQIVVHDHGWCVWGG